jgi:hypothetical protein
MELTLEDRVGILRSGFIMQIVQENNTHTQLNDRIKNAEDTLIVHEKQLGHLIKKNCPSESDMERWRDSRYFKRNDAADVKYNL